MEKWQGKEGKYMNDHFNIFKKKEEKNPGSRQWNLNSCGYAIIYPAEQEIH